MKVEKTTLVLGASLKPDRYSYRAVMSLRNKSIKTFAFGLRTGDIGDVAVFTSFPLEVEIHTVTMYVGAARQPQYYEDILGLMPERVIFNPGAENPDFSKLLIENGIEPVEACTLVMLSIGNY
ncbi:MAG: putative CoA-binding protein [Granulosicoccus sp.]|jgi:predicted CoA-binding protein